MTLAMWGALARTYDELSASPAVKTIILTGEGEAFCSGADISEFPQLRNSAEDVTHYEAIASECQNAITSSPKPTIAAIRGPCVGGGFALAQACDMRVSRSSGFFAVPAARLSIVYSLVETRNLVAAVGLSAAKEILFSGKRFSAQQMVELGFVNRLCEDEMAGAFALASDFADSAPLTIAGAKMILRAIVEGDAEKRHAAIDAAIERAARSRDYQEGIRAFAEKRPPVFTGE